MNIHKILLTTDLSRASRQAYGHAAAIARQFDAQVLLIHVNEAAAFGFHTSDDLVAYLTVVGERISRQLSEETRLLDELGIDVDVIDAAGTPSHEIIRAAEHEDVDLIVTARRGKSSARHLHFGSTARKLVLKSHVPLLVVPGEETIEEAFPGYRYIISTTDFSDDSDRGLRLCLDFAERFDAKVALTHVLKLPNPLPAVPGEPPLYFPRESLDDLQAFHERELQTLLDEVGSDRLEYSITINADAADGIMDVAKQSAADLVVIPSHGKGTLRSWIFGSTSQRVLKLSPIPVLVFPRAYLERTAGEETEKPPSPTE